MHHLVHGTEPRSHRHEPPAGRSLCAAVVCLASVAMAAALPGQWQGGHDAGPAAQTPGAPFAVSRFFIHHTGGDGGMAFSRGDMRGDQLDAAFWIDGMHGVCCGGYGAFYTADRGLTWDRIREQPRIEYPEAGASVTYYECELSGPRDIWLAEGAHPAAGRGLWHSPDAGATWTNVTERLPGPFESIWDLLVRGPHVWVLGGWSPEASYRSDDGGKSWEHLALPNGFEPFDAETPANEPLTELQTVYLLGARRGDRNRRIPALLRSDDGGAHWREIALPEAESLPWSIGQPTIAFATPDHGMLGLHAPGFRRRGHGRFENPAGSSASVLVTDDGGATWDRRALPNDEYYISALWCDPGDPAHAFAAVHNGFTVMMSGARQGPALYETRDGGLNWAVALRGRMEFNAIVGLDSRRVWAVGDRPGTGAMDVIAILETSKNGGGE